MVKTSKVSTVNSGRFHILRWLAAFTLVVMLMFDLIPLTGPVGNLIAQLGQPAPIVRASPGLVISGVEPTKAANDIDTPITITGTGFDSGSGDLQVFLDEVPLTQVNVLNTTTLTAHVPWGLAPGAYTLKVVDVGGDEAPLAAPFEVYSAIGQWNTNAIDGGPVHVVLPIAPVEGLVYAYSWTTSAIYRSSDSGATWSTAGHAAGQFFTYDPLPPLGNPGGFNYLYLNHLQSIDGGMTWRDMLPDGLWPGTEYGPGWETRAFPDPHQAGRIFLAAAEIPAGSGGSAGLLRSEDYGQTWMSVEIGLDEGDNHVTALAFISDNNIYLGTRDGNLYNTTDAGDTWSKFGSPVLESIGILAVNPSRTELWAATNFQVSASAKIARISLASASATLLTAWPQDQYPRNLGFLADNKVYMGTNWDGGWITEDNGVTWNGLMPQDGKPGYCLMQDPWDNSQETFYIADERYGVQKTVDAGVTWQIANTGLHAMSPDAIAVDPLDPSLVYQTVGNGWPGVFASADGGQHWVFSSFQTALGLENPDWAAIRPVTSTLATSGGRVFAGFHGRSDWGYGPQLMVSDDQAHTWKRVEVDPKPRKIGDKDAFHMPWTLKADPMNPNHLLLSALIGNRDLTTDQYVSEIYYSTDLGETWTRVNLAEQIGVEVNNLRDFAFDPHDPSQVYATAGVYIYKSSDGGLHWSLLLDASPYKIEGPVAIEPVPPYRIRVGALVSVDGGATWNPDFQMPFLPEKMLFVPGTATLYIAGEGLKVSFNSGATWQDALGAVSGVRVTSLAVSRVDQRTIVYLGTPGGESTLTAEAIGLNHVHSANYPALEAGVYRQTGLHYDLFLPVMRR